MLFFFPQGVLDEILNLIQSVSEGFPSYLCESLDKTFSKYKMEIPVEMTKIMKTESMAFEGRSR